MSVLKSACDLLCVVSEEALNSFHLAQTLSMNRDLRKMLLNKKITLVNVHKFTSGLIVLMDSIHRLGQCSV